MSTRNITSYVPNGFVVKATHDGGSAGSPLNEACYPTQGTDKKGPTAILNSVSKMPNVKVGAEQLLNMRFTPDSLEGEENLEKIVDFLMTSIVKHMYHKQFNVVDSRTLKQAQQHTELIVRVARDYAQYISLMKEAQDAIIARSENSL